jgi:Fic family protein
MYRTSSADEFCELFNRIGSLGFKKECIMNTLKQFRQQTPSIPMQTVWLLNDLAEYRGKQELFTNQPPQKLKKLREHALIESAVSSNRIEGVDIDRKRVGTVIFGKSMLQDRNEEEVRGYQSALAWIHAESQNIKISSASIKKLHTLTHPNIWDSGKFKKDDGEIIEKHADGRVTIRFRPTSAAQTPEALKNLCTLSQNSFRDKEIPPLVIWAAQNLDFLCIHPFRDGNGRVSRLLLLLSLYQLGFEAGRYISMERIIEQSKERYYETLKQSSLQWHEGKHDPWPYINYLLYTLKELYTEFERRLGQITLQKGAKAELVLNAVSKQNSPFRLVDIENACPGVGRDWIQALFSEMKTNGEISCSGRGPAARWTMNSKE